MVPASLLSKEMVKSWLDDAARHVD